MKNKPDKDTGSNLARALGLGSELGFNIALPLVAGILTGRYMDKWMGTHGIMLVIMLLLALIIGGYNFYRVISRVLQWK